MKKMECCEYGTCVLNMLHVLWENSLAWLEVEMIQLTLKQISCAFLYPITLQNMLLTYSRTFCTKHLIKTFQKWCKAPSALFFVDDEELNNVFLCELSCNLQFHIHKTPPLWQVILAIRTVVANLSKTFRLIVFIPLSNYENHLLI